MPWIHCLSYSMVIVVNTMYVTLSQQNKESLYFGLIIITMIIAATIILRIGEWYRLRQEGSRNGQSGE